MKHAEQLLDRFLARVTSTIGFRAIGGLQYEREASAATWLLSFSLRDDPRGYSAFTYGPGVLFAPLSKWLRPDVPGLEGKVPTIATVGNFLHPDKKYREWTFSNEEELENLWDPFLDELRLYALPFLERYSQFPEFRKAVESSTIPDEWLGYGEEERIRTKAVFRLLDADKAEALRILDDALAERAGKASKHWVRISLLRKRIASEG